MRASRRRPRRTLNRCPFMAGIVKLVARSGDAVNSAWGQLTHASSETDMLLKPLETIVEWLASLVHRVQITRRHCPIGQTSAIRSGVSPQLHLSIGCAKRWPSTAHQGGLAISSCGELQADHSAPRV